MTAGTVAPMLRVRGLTAAQGAIPVLNGLDLPDLQADRIIALLGPNGCGKSTLLKSIAGLIPAHAASLVSGTRDLRLLDATARAGSIRYLPQSLPADVHLTVTEAILVAFHARRPAARNSSMASVQSTLHDLGISHLGQRYLDELSGGQKQLVGLAQALIHQPEIMLLDEPLASLDLNYQHHVMQLLTRLSRERHFIAIIVLHDLNMALRYADQAWLMRQGTLIASGAPGEVITADTLARTFSIRARVERCSQGQPYVFVDDLIQI
jgi:iron complex transport system ATP-binding protein